MSRLRTVNTRVMHQVILEGEEYQVMFGLIHAPMPFRGVWTRPDDASWTVFFSIITLDHHFVKSRWSRSNEVKTASHTFLRRTTRMQHSTGTLLSKLQLDYDYSVQSQPVVFPTGKFRSSFSRPFKKNIYIYISSSCKATWRRWSQSMDSLWKRWSQSTVSLSQDWLLSPREAVNVLFAALIR